MDKSSETQQNVITMTMQNSKSGYAALSLVEAYWDALRAGREMPKRAEIDPRGIESALEHAFILERVAPGVARMRIAGTHLNDVMGMDARGMPLTSFFDQEARVRVAGLLEEVFQTPGTAEIAMHTPARAGQPAMDARMILLPLKSDLGDVSRILGCFVCPDFTATAPHRFQIRTVDMRRLNAGGGSMPLPDRSFGFSETPMPYERQRNAAAPSAQAEAATGRPPYLRLVK